jgi:hypothetical protein
MNSQELPRAIQGASFYLLQEVYSPNQMRMLQQKWNRLVCYARKNRRKYRRWSVAQHDDLPQERGIVG